MRRYVRRWAYRRSRGATGDFLAEREAQSQRTGEPLQGLQIYFLSPELLRVSASIGAESQTPAVRRGVSSIRHAVPKHDRLGFGTALRSQLALHRSSTRLVLH